MPPQAPIRASLPPASSPILSPGLKVCRLGGAPLRSAPLVVVAASPTLFRSMVVPCNLHSRSFHGELRYPYAQWPIGHLILPTRCGCGPIRVARLVWCGWMSAGWTKNRPIVSYRFVGRGAAFLVVKPTPPPFSRPGGSLCWLVPEGCPLRFLMVLVVSFRRHRGALDRKCVV